VHPAVDLAGGDARLYPLFQHVQDLVGKLAALADARDLLFRLDDDTVLGSASRISLSKKFQHYVQSLAFMGIGNRFVQDKSVIL
jgi:hypothetical protein